MYAFDYQRPASVDDAAGAAGDGRRFLAGGQSLIQAMRLRLSQSDALIDLGGLDALREIRAEGDDRIVIGAMATHAQVSMNEDVKRLNPCIAALAGGIGDPMVRNMGTIGGSIANADPAQCYPAGVLAMNATIRTNKRELPADGFFTGLYETRLEPGELITAVVFPAVKTASYLKYKQQASRFALVGVCVAKHPGGEVRVGVTGAKSHAFRSPELEAALTKDFSPAAAKAVKIGTADINADLHATAEYRAAMISVIASRAVEAALAR